MKTLAVICMFLCVHWTVGVPFSDDQLQGEDAFKALKELLKQMALLQGTSDHPVPPTPEGMKALLQETSDHPVPPPPEGMTTAELLSQSASIQAVPFGIRSTGWAPKLKICLHNQRRDSIHVYWIDYNGSPVNYSVFGPNVRYCQLTFGTHPWYITTTSGEPLEIIIPYQANMEISIKDQASW